MRFTTRDLEQLKQKNLIRGYVVPEKRKELKEPNGKIVAKHFKRADEKKNWIAATLLEWCQENSLQLIEEYRFDETGERRFRFDWAVVRILLAVEYEGGLLNPVSGHRSIKGINNDVTKYNLATMQGWRVIRLTTENYKTLPQALKKFEK